MTALIQILLISLIAGYQAHSINSSDPENYEKESKIELSKIDTPGNFEVHGASSDYYSEMNNGDMQTNSHHEKVDLVDNADKFSLSQDQSTSKTDLDRRRITHHNAGDSFDIFQDANRTDLEERHHRKDIYDDGHLFEIEETTNHRKASADAHGSSSERADKYSKILEEGDNSIRINSQASRNDTENASSIRSERNLESSQAIELGGYSMNSNSTSSSSEFHSKPSGSTSLSSFSRGLKQVSESKISSDSRLSSGSSKFGTSLGKIGVSTGNSGYSVTSGGRHHVSRSGDLFSYQPSQRVIQKNDFTSFGDSETSLALLYSKLESNLQGKNQFELAAYQPMFKKLESELKTEDFLAAMNRIQASLKTQKRSESVDINAILQLIQVEENKKISNQISTTLTQRLGKAYFLQDFALLFSIARDTKNGGQVDMSRILVPFMTKFNLSHQVAIQKITEILSEILVQTGCGKGLSLAFPSVGAAQTKDIQFIYAAKPKPVIPQFIDLSQISLSGSTSQNQIRQLIGSEFGFLKKQPKVEATKKVVDTFAGLLEEYKTYQKQINELQSLLQSKKLPEIKLVLQKPKYATICQSFGLDIQASSSQALMNQLISAQQNVFSLAETSLQEYKSRSSQCGFNTGSVLDKEFLNFSQSFQASSSSSFSASFGSI